MGTSDTGKAVRAMLTFGLGLTAIIGALVAGIVQYFHLGVGASALTAAAAVYVVAFCLTGNLFSDHGQRWPLMLGAAAGAAGGTYLAQMATGPMAWLIGGASIAILTTVGLAIIPPLGKSIFR